MCVRPSTEFYFRFSLDMGRSPGFGSAHADFGPIKTRFPFGSAPLVLNLASIRNSPDRSTKSTRSRLDALPQFVNTGFQVLFHSPPGVLFTFPSQYSALSVTEEYLALGGGPPDFPQGSSCLVVLWVPLTPFRFRLRGFHPLWPGFPTRLAAFRSLFAARNPGMLARRFRLFPFRSPLLWESIFLSLPPPT